MKSPVFYNPINTLIDWNSIDEIIHQYYHTEQSLNRKKDQVSDREQVRQEQFIKKFQGKGVGGEDRWLRKSARYLFGYKHYDAVDENGLILLVHTTTANEHESKGLKPLPDKTSKRLSSYIPKFIFVKDASD